MSNPPWRRRRPLRPGRGTVARADSQPPVRDSSRQQRLPRGVGSQTSGDSSGRETSTTGQSPGEVLPRGTAVPRTPDRRPRPISHIGKSAAAGSRGRSARLAGISVVGVVVLTSGLILIMGDDSATPETAVVETTQPQTILSPSSTASSSQVADSDVIPNEMPSLNAVIGSIVEIAADCQDGSWGGSGTIVLDGSYVLTNHHVAPDNKCEYVVCFTESWTEEPNCDAYGEQVAADIENDLAVLKLIDSFGNVYKSARQPIPISGVSASINDEIYLVGYPGVGGSTITSVRGVVSGVLKIPTGTSELQGEFIKTDARSGPGVSGGAAFNASGEYIGTPTGGRRNIEDGTSLDLVRPARFAEALLDQVSRG